MGAEEAGREPSWLGVDKRAGWARPHFVQPPKCLNCSSVFDDKSQMQGMQVGPIFSFSELGGTGWGGLDEPILDDGLVGFPGKPGDTSPNPGEDIKP